MLKHTINHEIYFKASQNNIDARMLRAVMKNIFFNLNWTTVVFDHSLVNKIDVCTLLIVK